MIFNSIEYAAFLLLVVLIYWRLGRRAQNALLLVASYAFYALWDYRFLGLLVGVTVTDFFLARAIAAEEQPGRKRLYLFASLAIDLGVLGFFKYFNFFAQGAASLLEAIGLNAGSLFLELILPLGISFYTFQTIGYVIEVYRGKLAPTDNLLDYALYLAFFPKLVAGPIERAGRFLPQVENQRSISQDGVASGLALIVLGLFMKVVIADTLAPVTDYALGEAYKGDQTSLQTLRALYFYGFQLYADFAGYTHIARGSARLLGFELMINFEQPYLARDVQDFWNRWHISLSTWFRDYLFFPISRALLGLTGRRFQLIVQVIAYLITMGLIGLWHGAQLHFIVWGLIHGGLLALNRLLPKAKPSQVKARPRWAQAGLDGLSTFVTFHLVTLAWAFFRDRGDVAMAYFRVLRRMDGLSDAPAVLAPVLVVGGILALLDVSQILTGEQAAIRRWPVWARSAAYALMIVAIVGFSGAVPEPFIYAGF
jgi:alginate O-acetyltransferase complex protein AlgI